MRRIFEWLFTKRHSFEARPGINDFEYRLAEYCQLPGGDWAIKRELTLPPSTGRLFLTMRLPKRGTPRGSVDQRILP
jgi:hypothetical protein